MASGEQVDLATIEAEAAALRAAPSVEDLTRQMGIQLMREAIAEERVGRQPMYLAGGSPTPEAAAAAARPRLGFVGEAQVVGSSLSYTGRALNF